MVVLADREHLFCLTVATPSRRSRVVGVVGRAGPVIRAPLGRRPVLGQGLVRHRALQGLGQGRVGERQQPTVTIAPRMIECLIDVSSSWIVNSADSLVLLPPRTLRGPSNSAVSLAVSRRPRQSDVQFTKGGSGLPRREIGDGRLVVSELARRLLVVLAGIAGHGAGCGRRREGHRGPTRMVSPSPTFTKGKFAVPINQEHIKGDWAARGYSTPKVTAYPASGRGRSTPTA